MIQPRVVDSLVGEKTQVDTREVGQQQPSRSWCQSSTAGPRRGHVTRELGMGLGTGLGGQRSRTAKGVSCCRRPVPIRPVCEMATRVLVGDLEELASEGKLEHVRVPVLSLCHLWWTGGSWGAFLASK